MKPNLEIHGPQRSAPRRLRSSWRPALGLLAAALGSGLLGARAEACGFPAGQLPPGSYAITCSDCTVQGTTLTCDCLRINQTLNRTSLDIGDCRSEPANDNGVLFCDRCSTVGACCQGGSCSQLSFAACEEVGEYKGDGSSCGQVDCGSGECDADLLTWVGGRSGAFGDPENWDPPRVPTAEDGRHCDTMLVQGGGDVVIDLDAPAPAPTAAGAAPAPIKRVGRLQVDRCRTFTPADGTIDADAISPLLGERSLEVLNGSTLILDSGAVLARHAAVGAAGEGTIEVIGTGGLLETEGRLGLGVHGSGNLLIADGATVIAAETVIGEQSSQGSLTVQGAASFLETGSLAVGLEDDGALTIEAGGQVSSDTSVIDFNLSGDSRGQAVVRGKDAAGNPSTWTADSLDVGPRGQLRIEGGGKLVVEGALRIGFEGADGDCLTGRACVRIDDGQIVTTALAVGSQGGAELQMGPNGGIEVSGSSVVGFLPAGGRWSIEGPNLGFPALVEDLSIAHVDGSRGTLELRNGAELSVGSLLRVGTGGASGVVRLITDSGASGTSVLSLVDDAVFGRTSAAPPNLRTYSADLELLPGSFVSDHELLIEATGRLTSNGGRVVLEAPAQLKNRGLVIGTLEVVGDYVQGGNGVVQGNVVETPPSSPSQQLRSSSSLLLAPLAAAPPLPPFEPIVVTGNAELAGIAKLQFGNGVAPKQGDAFELLQVEGDVTGAFDEIEIAGLAPGFDFASEIVNGKLVLTSLNDAQPLPAVSLAGKPTLVETKKGAKLKLTRSGDTSAPLTVAYTVGGSAESGVDYVALPGAIQFPARKKSVTLLVQPIADGLDEGSETIEIALAPNASFAPGLAPALTLELVDGKAK